MAEPRTADVHADLLSTALVGTDRRRARTHGVPGALGAALAAVPTADPAATLLDAAALAAVHRRAGVRPATGVAAPAPAPAETRPEAPSPAGRRLGLLLDDGDVELVVEWLELADRHGVRVPHALLPVLLDRARNDSTLRAPMLAVGGTRMRWLAAQHPAWHYLSRVSADEGADPVDDDWEYGDAGRRLRHLRALRAVDPAAARHKLADAWGREASAQRAVLLETFTVGLSADDERFLEAALDDRRTEVRQRAAALLARLPDSGYARRMAARAAACVRLRRRRLTVTPPGPLDEMARRDGLRATGAGRDLLDQILDATPLSGFRAMGGSVRALLRASTGDDQARLARAMALAAEREITVDFARATDAARELLSADDHRWFDRLYAALLASMPPDERGRIVADRVDRRDLGDNRTYHLAAACPRPWSAGLGRTALAALRRERGRLGYQAHRWAMLLGHRLPVELLPAAATLAGTDDTPYGLGRLGELAALRQQLHTEFS